MLADPLLQGADSKTRAEPQSRLAPRGVYAMKPSRFVKFFLHED
jgi:hypothetical protein